MLSREREPVGLGVELAEDQPYMEFFFKQFRAAAGIAQVFGGIAAGVDLDGGGAALESGVNIGHALAVRVIEALRDTQDGRQAASDALVEIG